VVIHLERGADLHMAQLMPLPLTVFCFSKIQIGFTLLIPAHPGRPGKRAVKRVCVSLFCVVTFGNLNFLHISVKLVLSHFNFCYFLLLLSLLKCLHILLAAVVIFWKNTARML